MKTLLALLWIGGAAAALSDGMGLLGAVVWPEAVGAYIAHNYTFWVR